MERCPVCRARLRAQPQCPRCGCDWSLPLQIAQQAELLEQEAVMQIAKGEREQARRLLRKALKLKPSPLARALLEFVHPNPGNQLHKPTTMGAASRAGRVSFQSKQPPDRL